MHRDSHLKHIHTCIHICVYVDEGKGWRLVRLVRVLQRIRFNRTSYLSINIYLSVYMELPHAFVEADNPRDLQSSSQRTRRDSPKASKFEIKERPMFQFERRGKTYGTGKRQSGRRYSLLFSRNQPFVLFRPSVDGMRPTHISESNLLYSVIYSGVVLLI